MSGGAAKVSTTTPDALWAFHAAAPSTRTMAAPAATVSSISATVIRCSMDFQRELPHLRAKMMPLVADQVALVFQEGVDRVVGAALPLQGRAQRQVDGG